MNFEENIKKNNILLPKATAPVGSYVATKIVGKLLYISGQISIDEKGELIKGKLGKELDTAAGYNAAERCALSITAQTKKACDGDLSKVKSLCKIYWSNSLKFFTSKESNDCCSKLSFKFPRINLKVFLIFLYDSAC